MGRNECQLHLRLNIVLVAKGKDTNFEPTLLKIKVNKSKKKYKKYSLEPVFKEGSEGEWVPEIRDCLHVYKETA